MRSSGAPEALSSPEREGSGIPAEMLEGIPTETLAVPGFESVARSVARALQAPLVALILTDGSTLTYVAEGDRRAQGWAHAPYPFDTEAAHWRVPHVVLDTMAEMKQPALPQELALTTAPIRFFASTPIFMLTGRQAGALCVMDFSPRTAISEDEAMALRDAAVLAGTGIVLRRYISKLDPVTQLPHRGAFFEDLHAWLAQVAEGLTLAVVEVAPVDRYSAFLRAMGHAYSDSLMRQASARVRVWAATDTRLYQVGVQRFAVLMPRLAIDSRAALFDPLIARLREPVDCLDIPLMLQPSIGVIDLPAIGLSGDDVLRSALTAAHSAHRELRGWTTYHPEEDAHQQQDFFLVTELATALHSGTELELYYQPRIDLDTGCCRALEALVRWRHPTLGYIPPGQFIPMAERSALMRVLTEWVLEQGFTHWAAWRREGLDIGLSMNISSADFDALLITRLQVAASRHELSLKGLELEFTEETLMLDSESTRGHLLTLQQHGIYIAIDDFGTGYSNLASLRQIPATCLKIDQSFVRSLAQNPRDAILVRTIASMARELGFRVVVEGVETREAHDALQALGCCDEAQGYYYAKPMAADRVAAWLAALHPSDFRPGSASSQGPVS